tara:strand:- start:510 stop:902 length:393 start_codon:yes stop_codon:yes gene_type:complete
MTKLRLFNMKNIIIFFILNLLYYNLLLADNSIIVLKCESENTETEIFIIGNYRIEGPSFTFKKNIYMENNILIAEEKKYKTTLTFKKKIIKKNSIKIDLNNYTVEFKEYTYKDEVINTANEKYFNYCYII